MPVWFTPSIIISIKDEMQRKLNLDSLKCQWTNDGLLNNLNEQPRFSWVLKFEVHICISLDQKFNSGMKCYESTQEKWVAWSVACMCIFLPFLVQMHKTTLSLGSDPFKSVVKTSKHISLTGLKFHTLCEQSVFRRLPKYFYHPEQIWISPE